MLDGEPLARRAARLFLEAGASPVLVVVGAHADQVTKALADQPVQVVFADAWEEGMGSSIAAGLRHLLNTAPASTRVLVSTCDQPGTSRAAVLALNQALDLAPTASIASAHYDGHDGPPVIFSAAHFPALAQLSGPDGAKAILRRNRDQVVRVDLPELAADIDHPDDYRAWLQRPAPSTQAD